MPQVTTLKRHTWDDQMWMNQINTARPLIIMFIYRYSTEHIPNILYLLYLHDSRSSQKRTLSFNAINDHAFVSV